MAARSRSTADEDGAVAGNGGGDHAAAFVSRFEDHRPDTGASELGCRREAARAGSDDGYCGVPGPTLSAAVGTGRALSVTKRLISRIASG